VVVFRKRTKVKPLIIHFVRDYPADPSPGMGGVVFSSGDEMDMGVKDGLAGGFSAVDADIKTPYRRVPAQDQGFKPFNQVMGVASFLMGHVKIVGTMAFRQNQHMVKTDGGGVFDGKCGFVLKDDTEGFDPAKGTRPNFFVL
jgi:hypothetical protein